MRNNNTFGIKNPTGSIGRYSTKDNIPKREAVKNKSDNSNNGKITKS